MIIRVALSLKKSCGQGGRSRDFESQLAADRVVARTTDAMELVHKERDVRVHVVFAFFVNEFHTGLRLTNFSLARYAALGLKMLMLMLMHSTATVEAALTAIPAIVILATLDPHPV